MTSEKPLSSKVTRTERRFNRKPYKHFRYIDVTTAVERLKKAHMEHTDDDFMLNKINEIFGEFK